MSGDDEKFYTHLANDKFGLPLGFVAPAFSSSDVDGKLIDLQTICKQYKGVFLNFFRGSW